MQATGVPCIKMAHARHWCPTKIWCTGQFLIHVTLLYTCCAMFFSMPKFLFHISFWGNEIQLLLLCPYCTVFILIVAHWAWARHEVDAWWCDQNLTSNSCIFDAKIINFTYFSAPTACWWRGACLFGHERLFEWLRYMHLKIFLDSMFIYPDKNPNLHPSYIQSW